MSTRADGSPGSAVGSRASGNPELEAGGLSSIVLLDGDHEGEHDRAPKRETAQ
jgi:hypothetical protein